MKAKDTLLLNNTITQNPISGFCPGFFERWAGGTCPFRCFTNCSCFDSLYGQIGLSRDKIKYPDRESPEFRSDSIKFHCKWRLPALHTRHRYNERT